MKRLKSGDIIEIFLPAIKRYCYCKYIDKRKYQDSVSYPFQLRLSSLLSTSKQELNNIDFSKLLFSPWHLTGHRKLVETGQWKVIGNLQPNSADFIKHHYKMEWPPNLLAIPNQVKQWRVLKDIEDVNKGVLVNYEQCSHLEYTGNHGALNFELRILVEYLKIENRLRDIDKTNWSKYEYILFEQFSAIPIYINLEASKQGRLIEK